MPQPTIPTAQPRKSCTQFWPDVSLQCLPAIYLFFSVTSTPQCTMIWVFVVAQLVLYLPTHLIVMAFAFLNYDVTTTLLSHNTYFQRKNTHQYTWYSNDGCTKKMIDNVIISKRCISLLKNYRTWRSAEFGNAGHWFVCAKVQLRLQAQQPERRPVAVNSEKLKETDTHLKYSIEVLNCFELLSTLSTREDAWEYFKSKTNVAAKLVLGKRGFPKKSWLTNETLQVIEQRRRARLLGHMATYRRLNGMQNRLIHRDRTQFIARESLWNWTSCKKRLG